MPLSHLLQKIKTIIIFIVRFNENESRYVQYWLPQRSPSKSPKLQIDPTSPCNWSNLSVGLVRGGSVELDLFTYRDKEWDIRMSRMHTALPAPTWTAASPNPNLNAYTTLCALLSDITRRWNLKFVYLYFTLITLCTIGTALPSAGTPHTPTTRSNRSFPTQYSRQIHVCH